MALIPLLLAAAEKPDRSEEPVFFPAPPATPRIQYLTHFTTSRDVTGERSWFFRYILGESEPIPIIKPYGVTAAPGKIYICDTMLGGLEIISLSDRTFEYFLPSGRGKLRKPINSCADDMGRLYVADAERGQVVVFDEELKYAGSIGETDRFKPTDVDYAGGKLWVCNLGERQIAGYDPLTYSAELTIPGTDSDESGRLFSPTNLAVTNDRIYVSDLGDFKIKVYTHDGKFISSVGSYGRNPGQFYRPKGLGVNRDSQLFAVDAGFENVQIFNEAGQPLMYFGGNYSGPGNMWLPAGIAIDYENVEYFREFVADGFILKYLIYVANQYGPEKITVYGFIEPE